MEVVVHRKVNELKDILPRWESLSKNSQHVTVFQDIHWIQSWWNYKLGRSNAVHPYIVEIKLQGKTIGIIPLYISVKKFANLNFKILKPMGAIISDYLVPILSNDYPIDKQLRAAFQKIYEDKANWDFFDWADIPAGSVFDKMFLNDIAKEFEYLGRERTFICPYLNITNDINEVKCQFNKSLNKEMQRKIRRLKRDGELKFHQVTEADEIIPVMKMFFEFHCERYQDTVNPSKFEYESERNYLTETAKRLLSNNLLHLTYLTFNDEIMAVEYALADKEKIYLYLTAFNIKFRKYSVGNILLYKLILDACKKGYRVVDFTRGDEEYKQEWGTIETFNVRYTFLNDTIKSTFYKLIHKTYYSKQFGERNIVEQLPVKVFIRTSAFLLSVSDRLLSKKVISE